MTYSCTDFTESVLNALNIIVPDEAMDNPEAQADLALGEIDRMDNAANLNGLLLKALSDMRGEIDAIKGYWTEGLDNFAQQADQAIAAAAGVPLIPAAAIVPLVVDWQAIAKALAGELRGCMHQIGQMRGMFDTDKTIQESMDDAEETMGRYNAALKGPSNIATATIWTLSTCIPNDAVPCIPDVYTDEASALAGFEAAMRGEWASNGPHDDDGPVPFPDGNPHNALEMLEEATAGREDDIEPWGGYIFMAHKVPMPIASVWTCTTDGDNCPLTTTVHATREEAEARARGELSDASDILTGDALSESWGAEFDGACIIEEHKRS